MKNLHITFDMDGFWIVANKFLFLLFPPTILVFEFSIVMSNVFLFPWKKKVQFDVGSDSNSGVLHVFFEPKQCKIKKPTLF